MNDDEREMLEGLNPYTRARDGASGTPVVLNEQYTWLLADGGLGNALDQLRDKIDDEARLSGKVSIEDVAEVAFTLLIMNYELTDEEAAGLIMGTSGKVLVPSVMTALFGPEEPRQTYTSWAITSMLANGINPDSVPGHYRQQVLDQLVLTNRAVPMSKFIDSAVAARQLAAFRSMVTPVTPSSDTPTVPPAPAETMS